MCCWHLVYINGCDIHHHAIFYGEQHFFVRNYKREIITSYFMYLRGANWCQRSAVPTYGDSHTYIGVHLLCRCLLTVYVCILRPIKTCLILHPILSRTINHDDGHLINRWISVDTAAHYWCPWTHHTDILNLFPIFQYTIQYNICGM